MWGHKLHFYNSDFYLTHQIQMQAEKVGFMTVGIDRNINLSCRFSRVIDTNQEFNVNQDLRGASQNGTFTYQARIRFFLLLYIRRNERTGHVESSCQTYLLFRRNIFWFRWASFSTNFESDCIIGHEIMIKMRNLT